MDKISEKNKMNKEINTLRSKFKKHAIDGYIVPKNDDYFTEYSKINRLKIISNFSGSAGLAIVLKDKNYLFTDGRYTIQSQIESGKNFGTEVIHVGSGNNLSVMDIIKGIEEAWDRKLDTKLVKMRPGEHKIEIALNPEPLKRLLNYELKFSLVEGLKLTLPYYKDQFNLQKKIKKN